MPTVAERFMTKVETRNTPAHKCPAVRGQASISVQFHRTNVDGIYS